MILLKLYREDLIKDLYEESFPKIERINFSYLLNCNKTDLFSLIENNQFIGFAFILLPTNYAYLFYCAIIPELRNNGYGTKMIELLKQYYKDRELVVDIEILDKFANNYDERLKRYDFYKNTGFKDTGYEMNDIQGQFRILSTSGLLNLDYFNESRKILPQSFIGTEIKRIPL